MAKDKRVFVCQQCGYESLKWMGRCPGCNEWNTMVEEVVKKKSDKEVAARKGNNPVPISTIDIDKEIRYSTGFQELNRVLGGGIVKGSAVLVGGDPGIGKSTLLLQMAGNMASQSKILYITGEESKKQIKLRGQRLGIDSENIFVLAETDLDFMLYQVEKIKPHLVVVDSIQTVYVPELTSVPGSVSQVRESAGRLIRMAKSYSIPVFLVGHVTKQGALAGPRILEHMVDTVLYFEGERYQSYRIIRGVKNRFGSTNEIGVFEMKDEGLIEVTDPSRLMIEGRPQGVPGTVVVCSLKGTRPMLVEIQALISASNLTMPRRMTTGIDYNRLSMLLAVMEKRVGMQLQGQDAFVNVIGGLKIDEPAADLGIVISIASSFRNQPVDENTIFIGEVGLTGEVRAANSIEKRVLEAKKMGFSRCIVPTGNQKQINQQDMEIIGVKNLRDTLEIVFSG